MGPRHERWSHRDDGGRFIGTGNIVVMRDPDTGWVNCGTYRVQLHDAQRSDRLAKAGSADRSLWSRAPEALGADGQPPSLLTRQDDANRHSEIV